MILVCLAPFRDSGTKTWDIGLENFGVEWVLDPVWNGSQMGLAPFRERRIAVLHNNDLFRERVILDRD